MRPSRKCSSVKRGIGCWLVLEIRRGRGGRRFLVIVVT